MMGQNAAQILAPYVKPGMTVLEPGPGMGFFTMELAQFVGDTGRVVAIDVQPKMITKLKKRAGKAGLTERIDARIASTESLNVSDLVRQVDFVLAFAVVHEMPSSKRFFAEIAHACRPGALVLLVEPAGHVKGEEFQAELQDAAEAGFAVRERPTIRRSHAVVLRNS